MENSEVKEKTIAVLPFVNMSGSEDIEYFSDGITEEIINALASIEHLKVTSRTSSFYFKNKQIPIKQIAEELNVANILEGSVRYANQMVRITAQLIHAKDDSHFWSETWDRKLENIFEIQDEISLYIAEKLREQYGHFEIQDHLVEKKTESLDAYEYSLKARYHYNKWNPNDAQIAINLFEKALELDPKHTDSYVGLADAYGFMSSTELIPPLEGWQKVRDFTNKAFALNPQHAGVHYQLANLAFFQDANFDESFKHISKSIELKPNYPEAQQFISLLYMISGNMEKAKHHLETALDIDPLSQETLFYKAFFLYRSEEYGKALDLYDMLLDNNPKNIPAHIVKSYCLLQLGEYNEVLKNMAGMPKELIVPGERLGIECLANILKKDNAETQKYLTCLQIEAQNSTSFQAHSYLYLAYANMGKKEEAFNWLAKVVQMKSPILLLSFNDPLAYNLKNEARHQEFSRQIYGLTPSFADSKNQKPPLIDAEAANHYTEKLIRFIEEEEPFLVPNLSLRSLADQVEIHPNKLSWLLNEKVGRNFNEFINHYRVDYFKKLALDPENSHISLIGLTYESGFNSKSVFNTYFKKEEGMTPKEFLKYKS
ncbi:MAG: helix-turn-helix domain-containing protein [Bacteroidales bacterium]|nr:helix-turn-helix domain-containing protein [Bacteroidales bacterium]MCF8455582.1 helix-turn-helix domain-containing protein [Bacteroidales bacterium]